jgi:acetyl-CoA acetyltransferase
MYDTTLGWRFTNPRLAQLHHPFSMGETGENVAQRCGVTREEQDEFALRSHQRAVAAIEEGRFHPDRAGHGAPAQGRAADHRA